MMLDTQSTFEALIRKVSPDAETRDKILGNRVYRHVADSFSGSQEYMATERLYDVMKSGRYDLVVLDTPPVKNALDFLESPGPDEPEAAPRRRRQDRLPADIGAAIHDLDSELVPPAPHPRPVSPADPFWAGSVGHGSGFLGVFDYYLVDGGWRRAQPASAQHLVSEAHGSLIF